MKNTGWMKFLYTISLCAWVFTVVLGVQFMLGVLAGYLLPTDLLTSTIGNAVFSVISYAFALFILLWLTPRVIEKWKEKKEKEPIKPIKFNRERMGLRGFPTWTDIGLAPIGYVVSVVLATGLTALFNFLPWFDANETQELGYSIYMPGFERGIAFIILAIIAPIAEELIFRGWLYGKLRIKIPKWIAILATSLVFGLIHLQWNVGITVFCMSVVTCTLREITGTIYAGMLVHIINNGVAFFLIYVVGVM